jgi:predicted nucleotidyltransferase
MTAVIEDKLDAIAVLCNTYDVQELAVFGSALRDDFDAESDIDFLVAFRTNDYGPFLEKLMDFEDALAALLGHPVDLATRQSVEQSDNYIRRNRILSSLRNVYVAG